MTEIDSLLNVDEDIEPDMDDLDDDFNEVIANLDIGECEEIKLPDDIDLSIIIDNIRAESVVTPMQLENNEILSRMNFSKLEQFAKCEYRKLLSLIEECPCSTTGQISSKDLGDFYTKVHQHANSLEFKMNCMKLFENETHYGVIHQRICFNISMALRKYIVSEKSRKVETTSRQISKRTVTHASRARIRYVGGYCIAKVRHKYVTKKASHRYSNNTSDKEVYEEAKCALKILNNLKEEEQNILACTEEPDSLLDISRRQNMNRGLTNIPDSLFHFFIKLTDKCLNMLTDINLNKMGSELFTVCQNEILSCTPLYEEFVKICFKEKDSYEQFIGSEGYIDELLQYMTLQIVQIEKIYRHIIKYHLIVMLNQFRKDILDRFQIEKKMAHRKQVRVASTGEKDIAAKAVKQVASTSTSKGKYKKCAQKKPEEHFTPTVVNPYLPPELVQSILNQSGLVLEPGPSVSTADADPSMICEQQSESESDVKCKVCDTIDKETEWIQCDSCDSWLHRNCAGLKHHLKWKKYQKKGSKFLCKDCE